jgi:hypothetical protein
MAAVSMVAATAMVPMVSTVPLFAVHVPRRCVCKVALLALDVAPLKTTTLKVARLLERVAAPLHEHGDALQLFQQFFVVDSIHSFPFTNTKVPY